MLRKFMFVGLLAVFGIGTTYANNKTVTYTLPSKQCKTFVGSWEGEKTFHFKTKKDDGGLILVEDKSDAKLILPLHSYSPSEGAMVSEGEIYHGLAYNFVESDTKITITSPKYNKHKLMFCNAVW